MAGKKKKIRKTPPDLSLSHDPNMLAISPPQISEEGFLTVLWVKGAPAVLKVHSSLISRVLSGSLVRHLNGTLKNKRVPGKTSMLALAEPFEAQKGSRWNPRKGLRWLQMNPFQPKKGPLFNRRMVSRRIAYDSQRDSGWVLNGTLKRVLGGTGC